MTTYTIDPAHSTVGFTVRHAGIGKTRGHFDTFAGTITVADESTPEGSSATATIDANSVNTGNEMRDNHLRSGDFFEVEQFPEWTFTSTNASGTRDEFVLTGDLTIHGVTKSVDIDVTFEGTATDAFGIISMIAMAPLVTIQILGLIFKYKEGQAARLARKEKGPFI